MEYGKQEHTMLQAIDLSFLDDRVSDEGYGSHNNSPGWSANHTFCFGEVAKKKTSLDCCGLLSSTWRPKSGLPSSVSNWGRNPVRAAILEKLATPLPKQLLPRTYNTKPANRVVVALDVESVSPTGEQIDRLKQNLDQDGPRPHFERKPWGIAVNTRTEQIYVADRQHHMVLVFGPDGEFQFQFGGEGQGEGRFNRPVAIAYDVTGDHIFVVDKDNHRIQAFDAKGNFLFQFGRHGKRAGQFWYPWGIAVSKDGSHIVVADARNHRLQLFKSDGTYIRQFTVYSKSSDRFKTVFNYPRGVAFDETGNHIYVTDFNLHCVFKLDINFTHLQKLVGAEELSRPSGIDVDASGNLIVCDSRHHALKVFKPDGHLLASYTRLRDSSFFDLPLDVAVMPAGFIAALDLNGRVRIF